MASPIKVGIIGLSAGAKTAWASSAHLPYLLSPRGRQRYQVVALCNSSVDAAKRAIAHFNLDPATTRAYGDPADLARDPDVDLVVTNTRVDKHLETTIAAAQAGKDLFIEWPLAGSREDAAMLAGAVKKRGQKTVVGLQGRVSPPADKIREILAAGKVGRVLSSEFRASGGLSRRDVVPVGLQYFTERKIGGNPLIIGFMHLFDTILDILGDPISIKTQLQLQRPQVRIVDPSKGNATVTTVTSDVPDLVVLTAVLPASSTVAEGATLSGRFRNGPPFPGEPALVWTLTCERAEVRLTAPGGSSLGVAAYLGGQPVIIEVHDFETEEVRNVEWKWDEEWQAELPVEARNIGQLYELFAEQDGGKGRVADFEAALKRHELLEAMLNDWDAQQKGASR